MLTGQQVKDAGESECRAVMTRIAYELLSPESLVEECELLRKMGPSIGERYGVWTCEGEASQWN
jgi:hypothetical protein